MRFTHLQIEWDPWLGGYRPQIPVLSALCPQLNLLNPPPPEKIPGYAIEQVNTVLENTFRHVSKCLETGGGHFEHYL
jgi:hypothetical protein